MKKLPTRFRDDNPTISPGGLKPTFPRRRGLVVLKNPSQNHRPNRESGSRDIVNALPVVPFGYKPFRPVGKLRLLMPGLTFYLVRNQIWRKVTISPRQILVYYCLPCHLVLSSVVEPAYQQNRSCASQNPQSFSYDTQNALSTS